VTFVVSLISLVALVLPRLLSITIVQYRRRPMLFDDDAAGSGFVWALLYGQRRYSTARVAAKNSAPIGRRTDTRDRVVHRQSLVGRYTPWQDQHIALYTYCSTCPRTVLRPRE